MVHFLFVRYEPRYKVVHLGSDLLQTVNVLENQIFPSHNFSYILTVNFMETNLNWSEHGVGNVSSRSFVGDISLEHQIHAGAMFNTRVRYYLHAGSMFNTHLRYSLHACREIILNLVKSNQIWIIITDLRLI